MGAILTLTEWPYLPGVCQSRGSRCGGQTQEGALLPGLLPVTPELKGQTHSRASAVGLRSAWFQPVRVFSPPLGPCDPCRAGMQQGYLRRLWAGGCGVPGSPPSVPRLPGFPPLFTCLLPVLCSTWSLPPCETPFPRRRRRPCGQAWARASSGCSSLLRARLCRCQRRFRAQLRTEGLGTRNLQVGARHSCFTVS